MNDGDHPILTIVGIVAVAVGLLMIFQPGFAAAIGTGYTAVTVVGLLALVQAIRIARARQTSDLQATETPDVETVESMPTSGDEFDRTVAEIRSGPRRILIRERADLREMLKEAALTAVADQENCSREQASEYIEAGTWTDDAHAAAFLGGADAPSPPLLDRMKIAASSESPFQHRIRRTADAVAEAAGVVDDANVNGDGEGDEGDSGRGGAGQGGSGQGGASHPRDDRSNDGGIGDETTDDYSGGDGTVADKPRTDEHRTNTEMTEQNNDTARKSEAEA